MKQSYKNSLRRSLIRVYTPCLYRMEKLRASLMWRRGVRACIKKRASLKPRLYMLFDSNTMQFVSVTYDIHKDAVSVRSLLRLGKMHVHRRPTVLDMKRESFYYTDSHWGAPTCDASAKLREWTAYYIRHISQPIQKLTSYKLKYSL